MDQDLERVEDDEETGNTNSERRFMNFDFGTLKLDGSKDTNPKKEIVDYTAFNSPVKEDEQNTSQPPTTNDYNSYHN